MRKETVLTFFSTEYDKDNLFKYGLFFKNSSNKSSYISGFIDNKWYNTAEEMQNEVLRTQTDFVKNNWIAIEVYTPEVNNYGNLSGGYVRLHVLRQECKEFVSVFKLVKKIDLKSIGCNGLAGSSPATHTKI